MKQIGLAARIWEGDNNNQYPMSVSVTNGGAKELLAAGDVAGYFRAMSKQLGTPKYLVCPYDTHCVPATNFTTDFNNLHISYFVCLDASETYPQMILMGDDNLAINGVPVKPGILEITNCDTVSWTAERHGGVGNISFADGSAAEESLPGWQTALQYATNGTPFSAVPLAIP